MAPIPEKALRAINAMKLMGISGQTTKPVLKKLLKLYENKWEYIEAENYRVLADAIFEMQDQEQGGDPKNELPDYNVFFGTADILVQGAGHKRTVAESSDPESGRTRTKASQEEHHLSPAMPRSDMHEDVLTKRRKIELETPPKAYLQQGRERLVSSMNLKDRIAEPYDLLPLNKKGNAFPLKEPKVEPGILQNNATSSSSAPVWPKDEPYDHDSPLFETPLAILGPPSTDSLPKEDCTRNASTLHPNNGTSLSQDECRLDGGKHHSSSSYKKASVSEIVTAQEASPSTFDIASSDLGEIKLSFICNSDQPDFHVPNLDAVFKRVEDRCLRSYKILEPNFSFKNLLKQMCQSFLELGSESAENIQENAVKIVPTIELLKQSSMPDIFGCAPSSSSHPLESAIPAKPGSVTKNHLSLVQNGFGNNENRASKKVKGPDIPESSNVMSSSLVVLQKPQLALSEPRPLHDFNDISKGEERVRISVVNEISKEQFPPSFNYIPQNIVYQNAYVSFSLARIGDEDCCADCFSDCLAAPIPCACARETGGEFAYTSDGLIKRNFLDEYISKNREPEKHPHFKCKDCPLERAKNEVSPEACKGHLIRKFIKECWSKCGCSKQCGNRVVQRGITCNLQVFLTPEGKGWGVRTLDELPRGSFVCEYVGEVLTNMELYDRTIQKTGDARHTYPVLLDADWGSEGTLKDEEALCLDATFFGNVARFVNHRCYDANLIEIPVEVETPDHHYYHLAFFTTRKVEPFEELTWDYGIDFNDHHHPIKAFKCRCGSKYCRDNRRNRAKAKALVLG